MVPIWASWRMLGDSSVGEVEDLFVDRHSLSQNVLALHEGSSSRKAVELSRVHTKHCYGRANLPVWLESLFTGALRIGIHANLRRILAAKRLRYGYSKSVFVGFILTKQMTRAEAMQNSATRPRKWMRISSTFRRS